MISDWILESYPAWKNCDPLKMSCRLCQGVHILGRGPNGIDILLPFVSVSRRHCALTVEPDAIWVEDLQSRNGTRLNGEVLLLGQRLPIDLDDVLLVTEVQLRVGRVMRFEPPWLRIAGTAVLALAQQIHQEGDWALLPILADALQDAGCTDDEVLRTCRRVLPRPCGSWVIDWLLVAGSL